MEPTQLVLHIMRDRRERTFDDILIRCKGEPVSRYDIKNALFTLVRDGKLAAVTVKETRIYKLFE